MSTADKLIAGLLDDDDFEHPGSLKIDGINDAADDGSAWHIRCHVCDSMLLVSTEKIGKEVKCNDCFSMLKVLPNADAAKLADTAKRATDVRDGSDLEIVDDSSDSPVALPPAPEDEKNSFDDSDELTLAPAPDLAPEITEAQKETFIDELDEDVPEITSEDLDDSDDDPIALMDPVPIPQVSPMFGLGAPDAVEEDHDDDSDEMIEMLDVAPEELNKQTELPRMPRKKGKQPDSIPVASDEESAPIRVHAKRRPKKEPPAEATRPASATKSFLFERASLNDVLDKAVGVLKTGNIWIWALVAIAVMSIGSSIWHWVSPHHYDPETTKLATRLIAWGAGSIFGLGIFFAGYILLLFVCGVIFRETAHGKTKVESVSITDAADFTSTMLLFGFSMAIAALPCMMFGYMWISLPIQFLLAGCFLFAAWKNQGAFSIISGSIAGSFSQHSASWKKWFAIAAIAAAGGIVGGLLLEVNWPIIAVFTSIAGSIIVTFSTLLYAAVSGWHCGNVVEQMKQADEDQD